MSTNADAADQVVSMSLQGLKVVAEISGAGAKNVAACLYAVLKEQKKTKGKTRLESMLRSGKELKVFAVKSEDLKRFTQEAKRYGILFCALRGKNDTDGMCDIMVRAEDASKINRIVERFKLATVDTAAIRTEIEKTKAEKEVIVRDTPADKSTDAMVDELMRKPPEPAAASSSEPNPTMATMEKGGPSEPISKSKSSPEKDIPVLNDAAAPERRSIRQELRDIRAAQKDDAETLDTPKKQKSRKYEPKHLAPKQKNIKERS
ncbi:MAG: PcfB family protein [Clostridiales bacterium]|nr:PcfB family protein [Clostridiales bacterium]